jgi:hypothetical protein
MAHLLSINVVCRAISRGEERRSTPPSGRRPFKAGVWRGASTSTVMVKAI